jgi:hypothetical protein
MGRSEKQRKARLAARRTRQQEQTEMPPGLSQVGKRLWRRMRGSLDQPTSAELQQITLRDSEVLLAEQRRQAAALRDRAALRARVAEYLGMSELAASSRQVAQNMEHIVGAGQAGSGGAA